MALRQIVSGRRGKSGTIEVIGRGVVLMNTRYSLGPGSRHGGERDINHKQNRAGKIPPGPFCQCRAHQLIPFSRCNSRT